MLVQVAVCLDVPFYELEDFKEAVKEANRRGRSVYTWKASGWANWMERGLSIADVLGLVLLPRGMPDYIEMPDDQRERD
jgi:hypothetical protein